MLHIVNPPHPGMSGSSNDMGGIASEVDIVGQQQHGWHFLQGIASEENQTLRFEIIIGIKNDKLKRVIKPMVSSFTTIAELKDIIEAETINEENPAGLARENFRLVFKEKEMLHDWETLGRLEMKAWDTVWVVVKVRGGAPSQKRRLLMADMQPREDDAEAIRMLFAEKNFKASVWLNDLANTPDKFKDYANALEKTKGVACIALIVERIPTFAGIKDCLTFVCVCF